MNEILQGEMTKEYVPLALLLAHDLSANAKIIWIVLYQDAPMIPERLLSPMRLSRRTGLTPQAVRRSLAQLEASRWGEIIRRPNDATNRIRHKSPKAYVPERLVTDRRIGVGARLLFGVLQGTPGFRHHMGCAAYADLARRMQRDPKSIAIDLRQLAAAGWLEFSPFHESGRLYFTLYDPTFVANQHILRRVRRRVRRTPFRSDVLLHRYLAMTTDAAEAAHNAAPDRVADPKHDPKGNGERPFENAALIDESGLEQLDLALIDEPDLQCHNKR